VSGDDLRNVAARHGSRLPLPDDESAALEEAEKVLVGFHCNKCGREWVTGKTTVMLWHSCPVVLEWARRRQAAVRRESFDWRPPRQRHDDERNAWAIDRFGPLRDALEDQVDDIALLRRLGEEE